MIMYSSALSFVQKRPALSSASLLLSNTFWSIPFAK